MSEKKGSDSDFPMENSDAFNGNGADGTDEVLSFGERKKNDELAAQLENTKNEYLYLKAEFENYKRNAIKERSDLVRFGAERLIRDLLGVLDNFERALEIKTTAENFPNFVKGIEMTSAELKSLLLRHGVQEVDTMGKPFDPHLHEALGAEESSAVPEGMISKIFKKPYKLHEKLVRPGQVMVAKKPSQ